MQGKCKFWGGNECLTFITEIWWQNLGPQLGVANWESTEKGKVLRAIPQITVSLFVFFWVQRGRLKPHCYHLVFLTLWGHWGEWQDWGNDPMHHRTRILVSAIWAVFYWRKMFCANVLHLTSFYACLTWWTSRELHVGTMFYLISYSLWHRFLPLAFKPWSHWKPKLQESSACDFNEKTHCWIYNTMDSYEHCTISYEYHSTLDDFCKIFAWDSRKMVAQWQ